jgi:membrane fusion protein, multidrug efflux system
MIDYVEPRLDPNTGTVRARGVFPNPENQLTPGFFARVRVPGSGKYEALFITDRAVATDQDQQYVLVVNADNVVEHRPIQLGPMIDGLRVVTAGLEPGDWVITSGIQRVRPGIAVTPQRSTMPEVTRVAGARTLPPEETQPVAKP